ncbi:3'-5' exonuclease [Paremcibacter congregatus]|uniref:DNA polymerase III subunit epsilon n=1 Tax=Paremcibacter congregatus TaxID=2043170 RepID=A0A2G4YW21_9PROT|nr:3'-5' exonuclease [Paremcibacter congregatus]PHZ86528.1 DNA polymerase III subunit epsilon [Paremcibacter congregatus]QDE26331.1 3'-5' exonuclease [Paremcibacter congregatus]
MQEPVLNFYDDAGFEQAIDQLGLSGGHRILRKITFPHPSQVNILKHSGMADYAIHRGIYLDTETTGLSHAEDEVIQLCLLPFLYAVDATTNYALIIGVYPPYVGFQEPTRLLTQEIIDLTGITMAMLVGQTLDVPKIESLLDKTDLVIAHNAAFDRPFTHGISGKFSEKKWACSMSNIPWKDQGFESLKLIHLAADLGFYFEPHQADKDCLAGLAILAQVGDAGESYFQQLIRAAAEDSVTLRAQFAPFELKDVLKQRGYLWKDGSDGIAKGWETVVPLSDADGERAWLSETIYHGAEKWYERREDALTRFTRAS